MRAPSDMCLHSCGRGGATTTAGHADPSLWPEPKAILLLLLLLLLPAGAWPQPWKEAEVRVTLIEKQLAAVYHVLLATEPIAGTAPIKVITSYPIAGWV